MGNCAGSREFKEQVKEKRTIDISTPEGLKQELMKRYKNKKYKFKRKGSPLRSLDIIIEQLEQMKDEVKDKYTITEREETESEHSSQDLNAQDDLVTEESKSESEQKTENEKNGPQVESILRKLVRQNTFARKNEEFIDDVGMSKKNSIVGGPPRINLTEIIIAHINKSAKEMQDREGIGKSMSKKYSSPHVTFTK